MLPNHWIFLLITRRTTQSRTLGFISEEKINKLNYPSMMVNLLYIEIVFLGPAVLYGVFNSSLFLGGGSEISFIRGKRLECIRQGARSRGNLGFFHLHYNFK